MSARRAHRRGKRLALLLSQLSRARGRAENKGSNHEEPSCGHPPGPLEPGPGHHLRGLERRGQGPHRRMRSELSPEPSGMADSITARSVLECVAESECALTYRAAHAGCVASTLPRTPELQSCFLQGNQQRTACRADLHACKTACGMDFQTCKDDCRMGGCRSLSSGRSAASRYEHRRCLASGQGEHTS